MARERKYSLLKCRCKRYRLIEQAFFKNREMWAGPAHLWGAFKDAHPMIRSDALVVRPIASCRACERVAV